MARATGHADRGYLREIHSYDGYKTGDQVVINYTGIRPHRGALMTTVHGDNLVARKVNGEPYSIGVSKTDAFSEAVVVLPDCPCCWGLIVSAAETITMNR